tara:strand:+ start:13 stop:741 length:729 start_codon:yes stop_codon:yes gene_type:complete
MKFVIPSYQRSQQLIKKTLTYLENQGVANEDVFIFIRVDDDDLQNYYLLKDKEYNVIVLIDVKGIGRTHNAITEHFEENEFIVEIDDDMTGLITNTGENVDFLKCCENMKNKMFEVGASYGGTYQCDNKMFMSQCKEYTYDLRYMLGCLRFRYVKKDIILETNYAEDMENCILHYRRDSVIVKNNWIAPKTANYSKGGCCGDGRNIESEKIDKEFLANKYPQCCKLFQRKSGVWDLRLKFKN